MECGSKQQSSIMLSRYEDFRVSFFMFIFFDSFHLVAIQKLTDKLLIQEVMKRLLFLSQGKRPKRSRSSVHTKSDRGKQLIQEFEMSILSLIFCVLTKFCLNYFLLCHLGRRWPKCKEKTLRQNLIKTHDNYAHSVFL